ncbi:MAG: DUF4136 domain-containing protein [Sphingomonadales bacterium]
MSKTKIITLVFGALLMGCSTSAPVRIGTDYNPEVDIASYQTFSWIADRAYIRTKTFLADSSRDRIQANIRNELTAKGYTFVSDPQEADFVVSFTVGSRKEISATSYPTYYRSGWTWGASYWGGGGVYAVGTYQPGTRYTGTNVTVKEYVEGQLAIDIFDVKAHEPAWHGTILSEITIKDRRNPRPLIDKAVATIMAEFPPN